jgi:ribosomal protein S15P/S13E
MLTKTKKTKTIADHRVHDKDTGSPEVQIALLTKKNRGISESFNQKQERLAFPTWSSFYGC